MKRGLQFFTFALGLAIGVVGSATLILGLWIADQEYFDFLGTGVYEQSFGVNGNVVPISIVLIVLGLVGSLLVAVSAILVCRNHPFVSMVGSP